MKKNKNLDDFLFDENKKPTRAESGWELGQWLSLYIDDKQTLEYVKASLDYHNIEKENSGKEHDSYDTDKLIVYMRCQKPLDEKYYGD